jgi:aspartate/methionine/tyrosine aminotransferase
MALHIGPLYHFGNYQDDEILSDEVFNKPNGGVARELAGAIHELHGQVGNAFIGNASIVIGVGAQQLLGAALYALSRSSCGSDHHAIAHARAPYYPKFKRQVEMSDCAAWSAQHSAPSGVSVEFLTHPNNPDGALAPPEYPDASLITDLVYYWPSMVPTVEQRRDDLMIFSLAKLTGYAASRLGWALVRDAEVAALMAEYMAVMNGGGPGVESQLRGAKALCAVTRSLHTADDFFAFVRGQLDERWAIINQTFAGQERFSIVGGRGQLFGWIQCVDAVVIQYGTCAAAFAASGILVSDGDPYQPGSGHRYARMCIGHPAPVFARLVRNLDALLHVAETACQQPSTCQSKRDSGVPSELRAMGPRSGQQTVPGGGTAQASADAKPLA